MVRADMTVYDYTVRKPDGQDKALSDFRGRVLLIVNTASRCGFTPQYRGLQELYARYRPQGFEVLGFPCNQFLRQEPAGNPEIQTFCQLNFGVTFPVFAKIDVNGSGAHPLYRYLTRAAPGLLGLQAIKWNFTKFLVSRNGMPVRRYAPLTPPEKLAAAIEIELAGGYGPIIAGGPEFQDQYLDLKDLREAKAQEGDASVSPLNTVRKELNI